MWTRRHECLQEACSQNVATENTVGNHDASRHGLRIGQCTCMQKPPIKPELLSFQFRIVRLEQSLMQGGGRIAVANPRHRQILKVHGSQDTEPNWAT